MTAFAYVDRRFPFDRVAVWLGNRQPDGAGGGTAHVAAPLELVMEPTDPAGVDVPPTLLLSEVHARVLLDALAAHFGGTSEVQTLRRDYDAERARVDLLIGQLARPTGIDRGVS